MLHVITLGAGFVKIFIHHHR